MLLIIPSVITGLGEVFVLGACLLSILRIPTVLTAPVDQSAMEPNGKPKWIETCGIDMAGISDLKDNSTHHSQLETLSLSTINALNNVIKFRNDYAQHFFHVDFDELHKTWINISYEWLPKIDKTLDAKTSEEHLSSVEFDTSLKNMYNYFQVFSAALKQLIYDMEMESEPFYTQFHEAETFLSAVLCESQYLLLLRGVTPHPDVPYEIMSDKIRKIDSSTDRYLRDFVIYRDYMNALQYAVDVMGYHLKIKSLEAN